MAQSALDNKDVQPTPAGLAKVLGPADSTWQDIVSRMEARYGPLDSEWSYSGAKYGWSCRLRRKKRVVLYLIPQDGALLVGIVLGDRALGLLRRDEISPEMLSIIDEAPRYGEGTGFRIPVTSPDDCASIELIIEAKMS